MLNCLGLNSRLYFPVFSWGFSAPCAVVCELPFTFRSIHVSAPVPLSLVYANHLKFLQLQYSVLFYILLNTYVHTFDYWWCLPLCTVWLKQNQQKNSRLSCVFIPSLQSFCDSYWNRPRSLLTIFVIRNNPVIRIYLPVGNRLGDEGNFLCSIWGSHSSPCDGHGVRWKLSTCRWSTWRASSRSEVDQARSRQQAEQIFCEEDKAL
jgi:hypothetical protein